MILLLFDCYDITVTNLLSILLPKSIFRDLYSTAQLIMQD